MHADATPEARYRALEARDSAYDGRFFAAVTTTGIFCLPSCPAPTPRFRNVEYFDTARAAVLAGYRPCKRCRPLATQDAPGWLDSLLAHLERRPGERWRDRDLRALDLDPGRVRAWFNTFHGMTFHAYARARGAGSALRPPRRHRPTNPGEAWDGFEALFGSATGTSAGGEAVVERVATPLGVLAVAATDHALVLAEFADRPMLRTQIRRLRERLDVVLRPGRNGLVDQAERELEEYFAGDRRTFDVPLATPGTPFQQTVWSQLLRIPYGQTRSYRDLAQAVGRPAAVRAVGKANGDNRIAIFIPCHRVVGADGALRGYGGGLWRKERLLVLEGSRGV